MINQLIPGEITVLRALADQRQRWAADLATITDLAPFTVRSILKELHRRRLVSRGQRVVDCGAYTITQHGIDELNRISQLRLVVSR